MSDIDRAVAQMPSVAIDAIYRKIAWRLMPIILLCYVASFVDRTNIAIAQLRMKTDLGFTDQVYGFGISLFFLGLILVEIPSNILLERIGAGKTLLRIMAIWGATSAAMMFVQNAATYYILRFILGAAEAGFFPGMLLYLSFWFPPQRRSRIMAIFVSAAPVSFIIGSPLSAWIVDSFEGVGGLWGWQWMFLLEGIPTILLGVIAWWLLPNGPQQAPWLTDQERLAITREFDAAGELAQTHIRTTASIFRDKRTWVLCVAGFGAYTLANAVSFWTPLIIASAGVTSLINTGLLAAMPPLLGVAAMLLSGWHADRRQERRWHAAGATLLAAFGLFALAFNHNDPIIVVALLALVTMGHYAGSSALWTIPALYYSPEQRARGVAIITTIGSVGAMLAPAMMGSIRTWTGSLSLGLIISAVMIAVGAIVLLRGMPASRLELGRIR